MAVSRFDFKIRQYIEHLEEASFLYTQRIGLHIDEDLSWLDIAKFEKRLDAHIDALVVGDLAALELFNDYLEGADAGEMFAIACVYIRMNKPQLFMVVFKEMDFDDAEKVKAVSDALILEANSQWVSELRKLPFKERPEFLKAILPLLSHRGVTFASKTMELIGPFLAGTPQLIHCCTNADLTSAPAIIPIIINFVQDDDHAVRHDAALVLLKHQQLARLKQKMGSLKIAQINYEAMAIATDSSLYQFINTLPDDQLTPSAIKALGLIGLPETIPKILPLLKDEEKAPAVAEALFTITGAPLYENVFVEDEFREDELFVEELEDFKNGKPPQHIDRPFGQYKRKISQDPELWLQWLQEYRNRFTVNKRHRMGVLISPSSLIQVIKSEACSHLVRKATVDELNIRYQCNVLFSVTDWVHKQINLLPEMEAWGSQWELECPGMAGKWFLEGQVCA